MTVLHRVLLVASVLVSQVHGQQSEAPTAGPRPEFRVLEQRTLPQNDGGSLTFKRVVPPAAVPIVPAPVPPAPTAAELARLQELESKTSTLLIVSASVNAQGHTLLRWHCNEGASLQAVCNVDFRLLAGLGSVETDTHFYSLILAVGEDPDPPTPEAALAAQHLPADGSPWFVLLDWQRARTAEEEAAVTALAALLDYFSAHKAELVALHAQRQAEAAARELAARSAPPPPPRHRTVHFWPLQPAQRAAIEATTAQQQQGGAQP